jgi:hypothetical protein
MTKKATRPAISPRPTNPPTTPPAIAPALDDFLAAPVEPAPPEVGVLDRRPVPDDVEPAVLAAVPVGLEAAPEDSGAAENE